MTRYSLSGAYRHMDQWQPDRYLPGGITECPRRIHRSSEDRWGQCMAEILEYYDPQYHSHYLLQCVDSIDHTFTGHQPGTGADQRRTR